MIDRPLMSSSRDRNNDEPIAGGGAAGRIRGAIAPVDDGTGYCARDALGVAASIFCKFGVDAQGLLFGISIVCGRGLGCPGAAPVAGRGRGGNLFLDMARINGDRHLGLFIRAHAIVGCSAGGDDGGKYHEEEDDRAFEIE